MSTVRIYILTQLTQLSYTLFQLLGMSMMIVHDKDTVKLEL